MKPIEGSLQIWLSPGNAGAWRWKIVTANYDVIGHRSEECKVIDNAVIAAEGAAAELGIRIVKREPPEDWSVKYEGHPNPPRLNFKYAADRIEGQRRLEADRLPSSEPCPLDDEVEDKTEGLVLHPGHKYRVRLVGKCFVYHQHWGPIICRSPGFDEYGKCIDPLMLKGFEPKQRFAIWVLDRDDGNKLKIMDFPTALHEGFEEWASENNFEKEPGSKDGCDWLIKVEESRRFTPEGEEVPAIAYKAHYLDRAPFTEEEIGRMKQLNIKEMLWQLRRPHTPEEINEMLRRVEERAKKEK